MTKISLNEKLLLGMLRDLEFIVTSLDRLGSAQVSDSDRASLCYRFLIDGDVFLEKRQQ
jgi:hypothetical protein